MLLPAPFGPSRATTSPGATLQLDLEIERAQLQPDPCGRASRRHLHRPVRPRRTTGRAGSTSTPNEMAISTRPARSPPRGSSRSERYTASGIVCVVPGKLPANVIVAPNSPSARAQASTAPATSAGRIAGSVTRRNVYQRDAPSVRDASSSRGSSWRSAASTVITRNGIATKVCATTTPAVVNGSVMPNQSSRYWPTSPRRPSAKNSATPPTTGGSTIDSGHSARTAPRPGNSTRASSQASGTPNTIDSAVAHSEVTSDSRSAVSAVSSVRYVHAFAHGARHSRPTSGSAKNATATPASDDGGQRHRQAGGRAIADSCRTESVLGEDLPGPTRRARSRRTPARPPGSGVGDQARSGTRRPR